MIRKLIVGTALFAIVCLSSSNVLAQASPVDCDVKRQSCAAMADFMFSICLSAVLGATDLRLERCIADLNNAIRHGRNSTLAFRDFKECKDNAMSILEIGIDVCREIKQEDLQYCDALLARCRAEQYNGL